MDRKAQPRIMTKLTHGTPTPRCHLLPYGPASTLLPDSCFCFLLLGCLPDTGSVPCSRNLSTISSSVMSSLRRFDGRKSPAFSQFCSHIFCTATLKPLNDRRPIHCVFGSVSSTSNTGLPRSHVTRESSV